MLLFNKVGHETVEKSMLTTVISKTNLFTVISNPIYLGLTVKVTKSIVV